jgi:hypothetical protein
MGMMSGGVSGMIVVEPRALALWHPRFALAILEGVPARPNLRTVQAVFSSFALNQPMEASFDQEITGYSIFSGVDITLDPTSAFPGNILKGLSDVTQTMNTGITTDLMVRSRGDHDYSPIPVQTPLELVPSVLARSAGVWAMDNPDNVKMRFTLIETPPGDGPLTVWVQFSFLVLADVNERDAFQCMPFHQARKLLRDRYGIGCSCGGPPVGPPAP